MSNDSLQRFETAIRTYWQNVIHEEYPYAPAEKCYFRYARSVLLSAQNKSSVEYGLASASNVTWLRIVSRNL